MAAKVQTPKPGRRPLVRPRKAEGNVTPVAPSKRGEQSTIPRFIHVEKAESNYTGPSKGFNTNKSKTPFRIAEFGQQPDRVLTQRTLQEAQVLREKYGSSPWKRGNLDAGIGNALGAKGFIAHVSGDAASEDAVYKFTPTALKTKFV